MKILLIGVYLVVDCDGEFDVTAAAASGDYESDAVTELAIVCRLLAAYEPVYSVRGSTTLRFTLYGWFVLAVLLNTYFAYFVTGCFCFTTDARLCDYIYNVGQKIALPNNFLRYFYSW